MPAGFNTRRPPSYCASEDDDDDEDDHDEDDHDNDDGDAVDNEDQLFVHAEHRHDEDVIGS